MQQNVFLVPYVYAIINFHTSCYKNKYVLVMLMLIDVISIEIVFCKKKYWNCIVVRHC